MNTARTALLLVNYNADEDILRILNWLASVPASFQPSVFVCNNSESQVSANLNFPYPLVVLPFEKNFGYFGGAQKILEAHPAIKNFEHVIVSNPDIEFGHSDFFVQLSKVKSSAAVLAPQIISGLSGQDTNPYMKYRPTKERMAFYKIVFSSFVTCQIYQVLGLLKAKLKSLLPASSEPAKDEEKIYAAHGSFMIFTKKYFNNDGNFLHGAFLYNEEVTVAEFCRSHQLEILYYPKLRVYHREHGSTGIFYSKKSLSFLKEASRYTAETYFK